MEDYAHDVLLLIANRKFCRQIVGASPVTTKQNYEREAYPLAKAVHSWTRKHYLSMRQKNTDVAESVLIGSVSFGEVGRRLVKTYFKGLNREAPKSYLDLEQPATPDSSSATGPTNK